MHFAFIIMLKYIAVNIAYTQVTNNYAVINCGGGIRFKY